MNIVHIFCDELRQDALGCYGNPVGPMHTPNIDSIAERGYLFENCFCNSPVCVPSRASMLTGLYPEQTNVFHNEASLPSFTLDRTFDTFPQVLSRSGYRTANFGKVHLPRQMEPFQYHDPEGSTMNLGLEKEEFDAVEKLSPMGRGILAIGGLYPQREYGPEKVVDNALRWMAQQQEPYYVRISILQPHTPVLVKRGYEKIYEDYPFSGKLGSLEGLSTFERTFAQVLDADSFTEEQIRTAKIHYYGMVCWVDDQVGRILSFLKEQKEETILIFNADHGALRGEAHGLSKQIFNRACHAVPLIIYDPRREGGQRVRTLCSNIDLARTIFGMLGIDPPDQFRGRDLFGDSREEPVFSSIGYGNEDSLALSLMRLGKDADGTGWPRRGCIRQGTYRLDMNVRKNGKPTTEAQEDIFFTDTALCPQEDVNMAEDIRYQEIISQLRQALRSHCG